MSVYIDKENCCGCEACNNICPKKCVTMDYDNEGFLYPIIDMNNCIGCNLCKKVCPYSKIEKVEVDFPPMYACINRDENIVKKSTSGGAFSAILEAFCDRNFIVYGANLDKEMNVRHIYIDNLKDIDKLRGAKYVQSVIGDSFIKVEKFLKNDKKVVFSGTPCQVAGLKSFLRKEYDNLLTIDLLCHGVPSTFVFKEYKEYMERLFKGKIIDIQFRDKENKKWDKHKVTLKFNNGKVYSKRGLDDAFEKGFYEGIFNRPSCHKCPFASVPRQGDFTLGDFWGIDCIKPSLYDNGGTSLLLINSKKAECLTEKLNNYLTLTQVSFNKAIEFNKNLVTHTLYNPKREEFMEYFINNEFDNVVKRYLTQRSLFRKVGSAVFGKKVRRRIKKLHILERK